MWQSWELFTNGRQFTVQNLDQLYVLNSSAHKTTRCDMICAVLNATLKTQIKRATVAGW